MDFLILPALLTLLVMPLFTLIEFTSFSIGRNLINKGSGLSRIKGHLIIDLIVFIYQPFIYVFLYDSAMEVDCCQIIHDLNNITFAPQHRLSIYIWVLLYTVFFFYTFYGKNRSTSPILEIIIQCCLFIGILFNILMIIHIGTLGLLGNTPIIMLLSMAIIKRNHDLINSKKISDTNLISNWCSQLLQLSVLKRFPIIIVLCFPIIIMVIGILLLFGQEPDSLIQAFTETYYHNFSKLDYLCDNVNCGGHYLCSVAANGNKKIVKPIRYGERNQSKIICNRQLLLSNAFEELLEKKIPKTHKLIRNKYDKIGDSIHKNNQVYQKKWVSNIIYILMKPLEFIFWLVLYSFYKNPENHIALQYVDWDKKKKIIKQIRNQKH